MAGRLNIVRRQDVARGFRDNRQLQQFQLSDVTPTGRVLGTGSFGSVEEVRPRSYYSCRTEL